MNESETGKNHPLPLGEVGLGGLRVDQTCDPRASRVPLPEGEGLPPQHGLRKLNPREPIQVLFPKLCGEFFGSLKTGRSAMARTLGSASPGFNFPVAMRKTICSG